MTRKEEFDGWKRFMDREDLKAEKGESSVFPADHRWTFVEDKQGNPKNGAAAMHDRYGSF